MFTLFGEGKMFLIARTNKQSHISVIPNILTYNQWGVSFETIQWSSDEHLNGAQMLRFKISSDQATLGQLE